MKLLFDQNISFRLIKKIARDFPQSYDLVQLGLDDAPDIKIWRYAKKNNFTIITFDGDFLEFNTLYGSPPKIIWLRTGNLTTNHLAELIIHRRKLIRAFLEDSSREILQIHIEE